MPKKLDLLTVKLNNRTYHVYADKITFLSDGNELELEGTAVFVNGKAKTDFGESFQGYRFDAEDVAESLIRSYVNDNRTIVFENVHEILRNFREVFFQDTGMEFNERKIPGKFLAEQELELNVVNTEGYQYYSNGDDFALVDPNGRLITDVEVFFMGSLMDDYDKGRFLYASPMIEEYKDEIFGKG